jgi:hypothetical protein
MQAFVQGISLDYNRGESANGRIGEWRMMNSLSLCVLSEHLAVCRLPPDAPLPKAPSKAGFWSATRTADELTVVLPEETVSVSWKAETGWRCFKVLGPLDFSLTGILAALATTLAEAGVPIFAVSTYDTDYILVKEENLDKAKQALIASGHSVK